MGKKIIIIGGGMAGLSAGIYSQMNGFETEIVEMHNIAGGQCTAWDRKGYRFDYCLHWLVGTIKSSFNRIWKETHVITDKTQIIDHDIFSKMVNDKGEELIIYTNIDRWEKYLLEIAPEDESSIRKMCKHMRTASLLELNVGDGFFPKMAALIKMAPMMPLFLKYGKKSCNEYFAELNFKNPRLSYFFNKMYGYRNFAAIAFIAMLAWFHQKNAGYIIGGSLPLAQRMTERYLSLGGKLTFSKKVSKIVVANNMARGVQLSDGSILNADYVISAADGRSTLYEMLGGKYLTPQIKDAYDNWELFTPLVQVSFGIDIKMNMEFPILSVMQDEIKIGSMLVENGYSLMVYQYDPTMAPEGKTTVVIRYESSWDNWEDLSHEAYKEEKEKIKADATTLLESHYPEVKGHIEVTDVATPLTDARYTGVWKGAYEGFAPSANNITKSLPNVLPGLQNFYMAGQWLQPGGGLPPSAASGKKAISAICKKEKKEFRVIE
ncbi:MAG TPA: NAD(P)/FAD-dependent oxidoreductase [Bacteroidales bacterium]|nr:NAD(P)/FAD-dependent oxidoreductase [Bacteroidales bacterium]